MGWRHARTGRMTCHNAAYRIIVDEVWPQVPVELRGGLTKRERELILGYGPEGV
jgi:hypothetical protein